MALEVSDYGRDGARVRQRWNWSITVSSAMMRSRSAASAMKPDRFGTGYYPSFHRASSIGIIDVKTLFGVESVKYTQSIDMVIKLEEWDKDKEYDRPGMEDQYTEFLGNKIVCHSIPIRPGRNLAIIVESAAVNYRTKKMGYNAAKELYKRVQANLARRD